MQLFATINECDYCIYRYCPHYSAASPQQGMELFFPLYFVPNAWQSACHPGDSLCLFSKLIETVKLSPNNRRHKINLKALKKERKAQIHVIKKQIHSSVLTCCIYSLNHLI